MGTERSGVWVVVRATCWVMFVAGVCMAVAWWQGFYSGVLESALDYRSYAEPLRLEF